MGNLLLVCIFRQKPLQLKLTLLHPYGLGLLWLSVYLYSDQFFFQSCTVNESHGVQFIVNRVKASSGPRVFSAMDTATVWRTSLSPYLPAVLASANLHMTNVEVVTGHSKFVHGERGLHWMGYAGGPWPEYTTPFPSQVHRAHATGCLLLASLLAYIPVLPMTSLNECCIGGSWGIGISENLLQCTVKEQSKGSGWRDCQVK